MLAAIRTLQERVGRRGLTLLFLAYLDVMIALGIHTSTAERLSQGAYRGAREVAPLSAWVAVWLLVALLCAISAFRRDDRVGFVAAAAVKVAWAMSYAVAWLLLGEPFAWTAASVYFAFGVLVLIISGWEENRREPMGISGSEPGQSTATGVGAGTGNDRDGSGRVLGTPSGEQGDGDAGGHATSGDPGSA